MAFETGTAFDYHDLLDKLRLFLTGSNTQATGAINFPGTPGNGDTVTISQAAVPGSPILAVSQTYTFQTALTDAPNNVLIGASATAARDNLLAALTGGAGAGTTYGTGTVVNSLVNAASAGANIDLTAKNSGSLGNFVALASTGVLTVSGANMTGGATGAGWTQLEHTPAVARNLTIPDPVKDQARQESVQTLTVRGPGTGISSRVFVTIETEADFVPRHFSWKLYGQTDWTSGLAVTAQPGASPTNPRLGLTAGSMTYWFYANDRRFIVVVRSGTTYVSSYCGFLLQNGAPSEYAFPLYIAGNYFENRIPQFPNVRNRFIADPGDNSAYYRTREGTWERIRNNSLNNSNAQGVDNIRAAFLWPQRSGTTADEENVDQNDWSLTGLTFMRANANGEIITFPCQVTDCRDDVWRLVGGLDGVIALPGFGRTVEESFAIRSATAIAFQNVFRNTFGDFMAIQETA